MVVAAILLGLLKTFGGLTGIAFAFGNEAYFEMLSSLPGQTEATRSMNQELQALTAAWMPITLPLSVAALLVGLTLFVGGLMLSGRRPAALRVVLLAFIAAIVVDLAGAVPNFMLQAQSNEISARAFEQMTGPEAQFMSGFGKSSRMISVVSAILFNVVFIGAYGACVWYLSRKDVQEAYQSETAAGRYG